MQDLAAARCKNLVNNNMLLREFVYFNDEDEDQKDDRRYDPRNDKSILDVNRTRKTRLTLRLINQLRLAAESHDQEKLEDLALVRAMYANPPAEAQPGPGL